MPGPARHRERLRIAADHPALPGHFPGRPVVPGVVVLDRAAAAIERWRGRAVQALPKVKFVAPLLPEQEAELLLECRGARVRFTLTRDGALLATGELELAP